MNNVALHTYCILISKYSIRQSLINMQISLPLLWNLDMSRVSKTFRVDYNHVRILIWIYSTQYNWTQCAETFRINSVSQFWMTCSKIQKEDGENISSLNYVYVFSNDLYWKYSRFEEKCGINQTWMILFIVNQISLCSISLVWKLPRNRPNVHNASKQCYSQHLHVAIRINSTINIWFLTTVNKTMRC